MRGTRQKEGKKKGEKERRTKMRGEEPNAVEKPERTTEGQRGR